MMMSTLTRTIVLMLWPAWAASEVCARWPYRYLVLEGGGVRGIAYCGAIRALEDAGLLVGIRGFAGASAGSMAASLLAANYSAAEVAVELRALDFNLLIDSSGSKIMDMSRLMKSFGWYKGDTLERTVDELLFRKVRVANVTFEQLYAATGKELRVAAACVNTGALTYFDRHAFADMPVSRAVRASSAIPFFFKPVWHAGRLYVDGGLVRSLPWDAYTKQRGPRESVLGWSLMRDGRLSGVDHKTHFESLPEFALQLFSIFGSSAINTREDYEADNEEFDLVSFNLSAINPVDFSLCESQKEFLTSEGYNKMADLLVKCGHAGEARLRRPTLLHATKCSTEHQQSGDEDMNRALTLVGSVLGTFSTNRSISPNLRLKQMACLVAFVVFAIVLLRNKTACWAILWRSRTYSLAEDLSKMPDDVCIDLQRRISQEVCMRLAARPAQHCKTA